MTRFPALGVGFFIRSVSLVAAALVLFVLPPSAHAAFPGDNGKIAYTDAQYGFGADRVAYGNIRTVSADGTGGTTVGDRVGSQPSWSPSGTKLAFASLSGSPSGHEAIFTVNPDGSGLALLTNEPFHDFSPAWSPDGTKIAFVSERDHDAQGQTVSEVYVMNADGTNQTRLTGTGPCAYEPVEQVYGPCPLKNALDWSPDGNKIVFASHDYIYDLDSRTWNAGGGYIQVANAYTGVVQTLSGGESPRWSPDGSKIAFFGFVGGNSYSDDILAMNPDGTGSTDLTYDRDWEVDPAWSPDGTRIAFIRHHCDPYPGGCTSDDIFAMNANGGGIGQITNTSSVNEASPNWQPIRPYPRPVGASPLEVAFVQAFRPCETSSADSQHGQPLGFPSCSNPTPTSSTARIGPNTVSIARIVVCPSNASSAFCNPAAGMPKPDVRFAGSIRDVRCASVVPAGCTPGGDYNPNTNPGPYTDGGNGKGGAQPPCLPSASSTTACLAGADLTEVAEIPGASLGGVGTPFEGRGVRITDRSNVPATVTDIGFPVPLDCLPTTSSTQGSTCGVNTTANALVPGVVGNGDTAVWQIGQLELRDSGPDGTRGNSDDELFATQGVFLP